jgi:aspartate kinase
MDFEAYKMGGGCLQDADSIYKAASILRNSGKPVLLTVSAFGKSTNMFEEMASDISNSKLLWSEIDQIINFYQEIIKGLFLVSTPNINILSEKVNEIRKLKFLKNFNSDFVYGEVVSKGEIISSEIVNFYLNCFGVKSKLIYATDFMLLDKPKNGEILPESEKLIRETFSGDLFSGGTKVIITQGFIGKTRDGFMSTMQKEGSDLTAASLMSLLEPDCRVFWKNVPGVIADPEDPKARVLREIPFRDFEVLQRQGIIGVLHPKCIDLLAKNGKEFFVKDFNNPSFPGTKVGGDKMSFYPDSAFCSDFII